MIKVFVKTNTTRKEVLVDVSSSPASVFNDLGVSTASSAINLNGKILTGTELDSSFEALGVADGGSVNLNSIVKADGASK